MWQTEGLPVDGRTLHRHGAQPGETGWIVGPVSEALFSRPIRRSRADRISETRQTLLRSAARVIATHGYAGASIARITEMAGVSQGSFYTYFPSRQALFDAVLPEAGHWLHAEDPAGFLAALLPFLDTEG